ncbi:MAG TPA: hypothetical protein VHC22_00480 [Pirellulales bacterium]|nr:hypothetical protein [Pirellulales bacterium]
MRTLWIIPVFALLAPAAAFLWAADPASLAPIKGVVLLKNGEVLSGTIARTGDYYHVSLPQGEIRLKATEVEKVAGGLEDLYEDKRGRIAPGKIQDHINLAEWCIEQTMVEQAAQELAAAAAIDPKHPRLPLLKRRLELIDRPGDAEKTVQAPTVEAGPSNDDLDRLVRGLPAHAVESFTSTVQPLLVNNCTAGGCHGPRSPGKLRLLRLSLSAPANRRLTQRNLYSVWQVVDSNQPAASPLLTQPIQPHGKAKGAIFSGREAAQYRQLVGWVYEVTRQRRPEDPPEADPPPVAVRERSQDKSKKERRGKPPAGTEVTAAPKPSKSGPSQDEPPPLLTLDESAATDEPIEGDLRAGPSDADGDPAAPNRSAKRLVHDDEYVPVDPFDAEVFNRRYFPPQ